MTPLDLYYAKTFAILFAFCGFMFGYFWLEGRRLDRLDAEDRRREERMQRMTGRPGGPGHRRG